MPEDALWQRCWRLVAAASDATASLVRGRRRTRFALARDGGLRIARTARDAALEWSPQHGWHSLIAAGDPRHALIAPYLPICSAHARAPLVIAQVGQSLDGFIATRTGDSHYVTGTEGLRHLHRLRALCDAVIVGSGTLIADDPRLTTRLVKGRHPVRVVVGERAATALRARVFNDGAAPTLLVSSSKQSCALPAGVEQIDVAAKAPGQIDLAALLATLRARGLARVLVEGGGVTISSFLEAGLLDRVHVVVSALFMGDGRRGLRVPAHDRLAQALRPSHASYVLGEDVLFDCDLRTPQAGTANRSS